ncbi:10234_t:CDS:2, partial [Funneliformis geosporum]
MLEIEGSKKIYRYKGVKFPVLNKTMNLWVESVTEGGVILTDSLIKEKPKFFANTFNIQEDELVFSNGDQVSRDCDSELSNYRSKGRDRGHDGEPSNRGFRDRGGERGGEPSNCGSRGRSGDHSGEPSNRRSKDHNGNHDGKP